MREHSKTAWEIASRYNSVLASATLTRALAAAIDGVIEECAKIAESHIGAGSMQSYDEACCDIAKAIRDTYAKG